MRDIVNEYSAAPERHEPTAEEKIKKLFDKVERIVREDCFVESYKDKATKEECIGVAVSKYFKWDSRIFKTFIEALEDANFTTPASEISEKYEKYF